MGYLTNYKFGQMILAVLVFAALIAVLLLIAKFAENIKGRGRNISAVAIFGGPALLLLSVGLIYPAIRTGIMSFQDRRSDDWVGFENYVFAFTNSDALIAFRNTFLWVFLVPIVSTAVGLVYAVLIDKSRMEKLYKTLLFMPMAISFVGAGIIWRFVYEYRGAGNTQIGLLNAVITGLGFEPVRFLQDPPWNTLFLIVVMIWIQAGFAMVILSAAIKAVPNDIVEAARLDGVNSWQLFWKITVPSIRASLVVVITTIMIATLKIFDITRTMTGARFDTQVLANQMYDFSFVQGNNGIGSAMAVIIFVLVIPIVVFNIIQMNKNKAVRG